MDGAFRTPFRAPFRTPFRREFAAPVQTDFRVIWPLLWLALAGTVIRCALWFRTIRHFVVSALLLQCLGVDMNGNGKVTFEKMLSELASGRKRSCQELGIDAIEAKRLFDRIAELQIDCELDGGSICIPGGLDLLNAAKIKAKLTEEARQSLKEIKVFTALDSTNTYLLGQTLRDQRGVLVLAEQQTAGRGRRGRSWVSPFGTNLYMSLLWRMPLTQARIAGLSLAVGLAVIQGLEAEGFHGIQMKWPNDLLLQGAKVAGILIEMKTSHNDYVDVVIGIGVNLQMPVGSGHLIGQPWKDLSADMPGKNRNSIAAGIVSSLIMVLEGFAQTGFAGFRQAWADKDAFFNMPVEIHLGDTILTGIARGVSEEGAACIEVDGELKEFHGGEITLRMSNAAKIS